MLERIVVARDRSEASEFAATVAFALAATSGAAVTLVHVTDDADLAGRAALEELAGQAPAGVEIRRQLLRGSAVEQLRDFAARDGTDLIVAGTHGTRGLRPVLLGSVSRGLLERAPCSLLLVRHSPPVHNNGPVLVGVDDSASARAAADIGQRIAAALSAPLLLVHVLDTHVPFGGSEPSAALRAEIEHDGRKLIREMRATLTAPLEAIDGELRDGQATEGLLEACTVHRPRLIIVGHHGRGAVGRLLGSTARDIADAAPCPVLIAKARTDER